MRDPAEIGLAALVLAPDGGQEALEATVAGIASQGALREREVERLPAGAPFGAALARLSARFPDRDIAVITAGAVLPFAWDLRLAKAAHAEEGIAASLPLCDASPLHGLLDEGVKAIAAGKEDLIDRSAFSMGTRGYYETPALHVACAWLRGDALAEERDWLASAEGDGREVLGALARRWRARGRQVVLCDYVYVGFGGKDAEGCPADPIEAAAFARHSPLGSLRRAVGEAFAAGLPPVSAPGLDRRPVQLHVMHFWGGGLDKWVREFSRADAQRVNLLFATYRIGDEGGQRIVLYSDPDARVPVRTWDIARPILSTAVSSLEYRRVLEQVLADYCVDAIVISSLIGHSLEVLRQPLPTVVVAHDFYPLCQAINPRFDEACPGCRPQDLAGCQHRNPHFRTLGCPAPDAWQALRDAYVAALVERDILVVTPGRAVAETLTRLDPRMGQVRMRTIPHGMEFEAAPLAPPAARADRKLRLVVAGRLAENKGLGLLREAGPALRGIADVTLVGCGPHAIPVARELGWEAIEQYRLEELPGIVARIAPHAAVLASVVPESFSYTLSETWALGIPPLATALGAFRERIRDGVDGFLFEPTAAALVSLVASLRADPARLAAAARTIAEMPRPRSAADMVADYHAVVPLERRPVARFAVGAGAHTALTEPYRQLSEAYASLSEAYSKTQAAYAHARSEFERAHAQAQKLKLVTERYGRQLDELRLGRLWWRAPEAERLLAQMRRELDAPEESGQGT